METTQNPPANKRPFWKKRWFWALIITTVLILAGYNIFKKPASKNVTKEVVANELDSTRLVKSDQINPAIINGSSVTVSRYFANDVQYLIEFQTESDPDMPQLSSTKKLVLYKEVTDASEMVSILAGSDNTRSREEKEEEPEEVKVDTIPIFTIELKKDMNHEQVLLLQRALNQMGYSVAPTGNGSSGNETRDYGKRTSKALATFKNDFKSRITDEFGTPDLSGDILDVNTRKFINAYLIEMGMVEAVKASD